MKPNAIVWTLAVVWILNLRRNIDLFFGGKRRIR